jgi:hypothetical protein
MDGRMLAKLLAERDIGVTNGSFDGPEILRWIADGGTPAD